MKQIENTQLINATGGVMDGSLVCNVWASEVAVAYVNNDFSTAFEFMAKMAAEDCDNIFAPL